MGWAIGFDTWLVSRYAIYIDRAAVRDLETAALGDLIDGWWAEHLETPEGIHYLPPKLAEISHRGLLLQFAIDHWKAASADSVATGKTPSWIRGRLGIDWGAGAIWTLQLSEGVGWPARAFESSVRFASSSASPPYWAAEVTSGVAVGDPSSFWSAAPGTDPMLTLRQWALPTRPIFSGLLVNIAVWGVFAVAVRLAAGSMLALIRSRRGRCLRCGHLLGGASVCPECGARLAIRAA